MKQQEECWKMNWHSYEEEDDAMIVVVSVRRSQITDK